MSSYDQRSHDSSAGRSPVPQQKRLGGYLVEAGLLTPAQVSVALNDQKITGMRFGEILAARGWVKQQTIEYLMKKVILPEKKALENSRARLLETNHGNPLSSNRKQPHQSASVESASEHRRELPISKPLPSYGSTDDNDGVSWVG